MASLIPIEEMTELKSASAVAEVAKEAVAIHEKESVASLINGAANCGQHNVTCNHALSEELQIELKAQGYRLTKNNHSANPNVSWTIAGF